MEIEAARSNLSVSIASDRPLQNGAESASETESNTSVSGKLNTVNASQLNADKQSNEVTATAPDIQSAVGQVSDFVQAQNRNLNFSFDDESQRSIVKVTDSETGELIRQIPSEEVLRLSERIQNLQSDVDSTVGVLFNKEV